MLNLVDQNKAQVLTDQIKNAEWLVLTRQQVIDFRTSVLVRKLCRQMTEPSSLLLAGGIGFIMGEITKRQPAKARGAAAKVGSSEISPLKVALNLLTSVRTLYTALPIAWIMKSRYKPGASAPTSQQKFQSVPVSEAAHNRRRRRDDRSPPTEYSKAREKP